MTSDTQIVGWVWDKKHPDVALNVTIRDGQKPLATVKADGFRKDLIDSKVGDGKHGFECTMPSACKDGHPHMIHIFITDTQFELQGSPREYKFTEEAEAAEKPAP